MGRLYSSPFSIFYSMNIISTLLISVSDRQPANFEDAITAAGYGKFNILLIFIVIPCSFAQIVENLGLAYVIPIAQCDLNLSLKDKGVLNSVGYAGEY